MICSQLTRNLQIFDGGYHCILRVGFEVVCIFFSFSFFFFSQKYFKFNIADREHFYEGLFVENASFIQPAGLSFEVLIGISYWKWSQI